ncbi:MAG: UDP-glucose 4-epimerase GalE [Saprospiraceae bacterium]|nr:UDP-glucose 4-epimerase GalE [Saprospiraceae bacterium]
MKKILVTGGAGYIGSHTIVDLIQNNYQVISVDSYLNSSEDVFEGIAKITGVSVKNIPIDLAATESLNFLKEQVGKVDGVIHFAALKSVEESVLKPLSYYQNNLGSLLHILKYIEEMAIPHFIFSSSCTVYGEATELPVTEDTVFSPATSPYGRTKQISEYMIQDFYQNSNWDLKAISLRYFNPAGAHPSHLIGESPANPAQNLVPVITETAIGKRKSMTVYGTDYPTRDGSCIRDYVHVSDLARAHTLALHKLESTKNTRPVDFFNLGMGQGVTVLEAIQAFEKVNKLKLNYILGPRRLGDLPAVYADNSKAIALLGWKPIYNIEHIMKDAWEWEKLSTK